MELHPDFWRVTTASFGDCTYVVRFKVDKRTLTFIKTKYMDCMVSAMLIFCNFYYWVEVSAI